MKAAQNPLGFLLPWLWSGQGPWRLLDGYGRAARKLMQWMVFPIWVKESFFLHKLVGNRAPDKKLPRRGKVD